MRFKTLLVTLFLAIVFASGATKVQAASINSIAPGNWNTPTTWDCACIPTLTDDVSVRHDVAVNMVSQVSNLTVASAATITINAGRFLEIHGNLIGSFFGTGQTIEGSGNFVMGGTGTAMIFGNIEILNTGDKTISKDVNILAGDISFANSDLFINGANTVTNLNSSGLYFKAGSAINGSSSLFSVFLQGFNALLISQNPASFIGPNVSFDAETNYNTVEYSNVVKPSKHIVAGGKFQVVRMVEENSDLELNGTLIIIDQLFWDNKNIVLDVSALNHSIEIQGDWVNRSTAADPFLQRNGTVEFNGSAAQQIDSDVEEAFYNLTIGQGIAESVTFYKNIFVENILRMTRGYLIGNTAGLYVGILNDGDILEGNSFSYIHAHGTDGSSGVFVRKFFDDPQNINFPVGNSSNYQPIQINLNSATFGGGDYIDLRVSTTETGHPDKPTGAFSNLYWMLTSNGFTAINYDLTSTYGAEFTGPEFDLMAARWDGTDWTYYDPAEFLSNRLTTSIGITDLPADHHFAGIGNLSFPIKITDFSVRALDRSILLDWVSANESADDFIMIQRSTDGDQFEMIGIVDGNEDGPADKKRQFEDTDPVIGLAYYRLATTDVEGNTAYSEVRTATLGEPLTEKLTVLGNPVNAANGLSVQFTSIQQGQLSLKLIDNRGAMVADMQQVVEQGTNEISMQLISGIPAGVYHLVATQGASRLNQRVIVVN